MKKIAVLLPKVLRSEDPDAVHDVRVATRRMQQGLDALFPKPRPRKVRTLRRNLRRIRRSIGEWRNLDVVLQLVAERQRDAPSRRQRSAWDLVDRELRLEREREIQRARRKLRRRRLTHLAHAGTRLVPAPAIDADELTRTVRDSVAACASTWQSALVRAREGRRVEDLHALRIATKRLRYGIEVAGDLGQDPRSQTLRSLEQLQDALGLWHDRQTMTLWIARVLARPEVLLREPARVCVVLRALERDRREDRARIERLLSLADTPPLSNRVAAS